MKKIATFCFTVFFIIIFVTCKKKITTVSYTPSCSGTKSYINNVAPLLQSYCTSCHNTYSNYTSVKNSASSIRSSIVNGSMPKNSTLTEDQKKQYCMLD